MNIFNDNLKDSDSESDSDIDLKNVPEESSDENSSDYNKNKEPKNKDKEIKPKNKKDIKYKPSYRKKSKDNTMNDIEIIASILEKQKARLSNENIETFLHKNKINNVEINNRIYWNRSELAKLMGYESTNPFYEINKSDIIKVKRSCYITTNVFENKLINSHVRNPIIIDILLQLNKPIKNVPIAVIRYYSIREYLKKHFKELEYNCSYEYKVDWSDENYFKVDLVFRFKGVNRYKPSSATCDFIYFNKSNVCFTPLDI